MKIFRIMNSMSKQTNQCDWVCDLKKEREKKNDSGQDVNTNVQHTIFHYVVKDQANMTKETTTEK